MQTDTHQRDLMKKVAEGDARAFRDLTLLLGPEMFRLAMRLLQSRRDLAEDAVQNALIKLWQTAPQWEPRAPLRAYVSRLLYTAAIDQHRRNKPHAELEDEAYTDPSASAFDLLAAGQTRKNVLAALDTLNARQREAVLLYYMQEHPQKQVATILQTTEKGVERLLAKARKKLVTVLRPVAKEEGVLK